MQTKTLGRECLGLRALATSLVGTCGPSSAANLERVQHQPLQKAQGGALSRQEVQVSGPFCPYAYLADHSQQHREAPGQ